MAKKSEKGIKPELFAKRVADKTASIINTEMLQLEREASKATPVNVGALKGGWFYIPFNGEKAVLAQSKQYYLPVELGRKPGKGISEVGQRAVARWAKLKLGITDPKDAKSFAYLLSEKYKRVGRKPQQILGLTSDLEPIPGALLDRTFKKIDSELDKI